jgi:hypothetical protein
MGPKRGNCQPTPGKLQVVGWQLPGNTPDPAQRAWDGTGKSWDETGKFIFSKVTPIFAQLPYYVTPFLEPHQLYDGRLFERYRGREFLHQVGHPVEPELAREVEARKVERGKQQCLLVAGTTQLDGQPGLE